MLASATMPAGGDALQLHRPGDPERPDGAGAPAVQERLGRRVHASRANWIAAFVASKPLVVRGLPSGVVFGLFGSTC